jgi:hypothetical protein
MGLDWVVSMKSKIIDKVSFYNSCSLFKRIWFSITRKRDFVPTQNEKNLYKLYGIQEKHG